MKKDNGKDNKKGKEKGIDMSFDELKFHDIDKMCGLIETMITTIGNEELDAEDAKKVGNMTVTAGIVRAIQHANKRDPRECVIVALNANKMHNSGTMKGLTANAIETNFIIVYKGPIAPIKMEGFVPGMLEGLSPKYSDILIIDFEENRVAHIFREIEEETITALKNAFRNMINKSDGEPVISDIDAARDKADKIIEALKEAFKEENPEDIVTDDDRAAFEKRLTDKLNAMGFDIEIVGSEEELVERVVEEKEKKKKKADEINKRIDKRQKEEKQPKSKLSKDMKDLLGNIDI